MKKIFFAVLTVYIISSCARLDDNLFNADGKITSYKLDKYQGEVDFILDPSYTIESDKINQFTLNSEGNIIQAIYIGDISKIEKDTVIIYCHGNKDHMDFYWQRAKLLAHVGGKNNYGVMMIDYRGYGLSKGKHTEEGLYQDVNAAINWLKLNGLKGERLIMYGFSLGSAPATELTANSRSLIPYKLILEAPFASAAVMVQDAALLEIPSSYFVNLKIDNAEEIKKVQQPFLWIHGIKDDFLNIKTHGELVYKNYKGKNGYSYRIENANHGSIPNTLGYNNYLKILHEFIKQ